MKVEQLFEAKRVATDTGYYTPGYDEDAKIIRGTVKDWLSRLGAAPEQIADAVQQARSLPSYSMLHLYDKSTPAERKNGTFSFKKPDRDEQRDEKYIVYANGQIRSSAKGSFGDHRPTRLASPKPRVVANDPVKSLVKIYDGAFKELVKKMDVRKARTDKTLKREPVEYKGTQYFLTSERSKFNDEYRPVILQKGGAVSYVGGKSFPTQDKALEHARKVFNGEVSGFRH